jgi:hypothetical protein
MRRSSVLASILWIAIGCQSAPPPKPHDGVAKRWGQFLSMPHQRAFALAGDPEGEWIGATVGGYPSPTEAEQAALRECEKRRASRIATPCRLYATGHRIVWSDSKPSPDPAPSP